MTIQTDASTKEWGAHCKGISTGGNRRNVLEFMAVKFAILTFTKNLSILTAHTQMDKNVILSYLLKMGSTRSLDIL